MSKEVYSKEDLKEAIESGESEIFSYDNEVVKKLNAVKLAKTCGPTTVGGIIAAIPLVVATGPIGAGMIAGLAPSAGVATSTIVTLVVVIGGSIAINLFTDWDYVEIGAGGIKMKRK